MESSDGPRAKRQKVDKKGRFAALERLKQLKGSKHKYEVSELENVYEEVDEKEYSKKVLERQDDDWIVDDDGCGYVEDGREIFDDDLHDDAILSASKNKKEKSGSKRGRLGKKQSDQVLSESGPNKSSNIRNMLMNMPSKKKEASVKLDEDAILGDIMEELNSSGASSDILRPTPPRSTPVRKCTPMHSPLTPDFAAREYIKSLKSITPLRPKSSLNSFTPRTIVKEEPPIIDDKDDSEPESESIIVDTPPSEITKPSLSQTIDDFDSNDIILDDAAFKEMDMECRQAEDDKGNACNGTVLPPDSKKENLCNGSVKPQKHLMNGVLKPKIEENFPAVWESMAGAGVNGSSATTTDVTLDLSQLPLLSTETGEKVLRLFWWDAYEEGFKQPGVVYLFGKVWIESAKTHVSCCVAVKNIPRRVYFLPREKHYDMEKKVSTDKDVTMMDLYKEFNDKIAERHKILQFKSRKVERNYAFSIPGVPDTSEYLEVLYSANQPMLPSDLQGETFSHVFGTNTSALEHLLLERKMKGPCWLDLKYAQPVSNPVSWCKIEAIVLKPEHVTICNVVPSPAPPPLVVATLNIRTVLHPTSGQNEIVMIGCLIHNSFHVDKAPPQPPFQQHFCTFTRPSDLAWPFDLNSALPRYTSTKLEKMDTERALLGFFLAKLYKLDPDLIVGHDLHGYGLELLMHRMNVNKIPQWSKLGRLRRANIQSSSKGRSIQLEKNVMSGRLVCDVKISAKELIRARSYDLGALCQTVLHVKEEDRVEVTDDEVKSLYGASQSLLQLVSCTMQDAAYIIRLMCELNVLPLALQITNIAGNVMSRTLMGGRSERNEFLLLHAFTEKQYIVPDKQYGKKPIHQPDELDMDEAESAQRKGRNGKRKPAYTGGLVLEPRKGFYDTLILLMDFNSLYPSIIQEYNICFTTISLGALAVNSETDEEMLVEPPQPGMELGILPTEIRKLVESRREVKKLMKTPDLPSDLKMQYNIRQMALKLTANSMYGCLGFSYSRFYAMPLAALVTAKGREILMNTKELVEKLRYQVIYGDTDSIMINTNCLEYDQVFKIGHKIKTEVNKLYKQVELDIDGVFKYMLLLKKKKYAAVTISRLPNGELVTQQELKGLDIVRRDWSQLSAEAGKFVLEQILSDQDPDDRILNIHEHLEKLRVDLQEGRVPISLLTITKQLTKNPEDYADKKSLPHVQVALRLNEHGGRKFRQGDTVPYVICEDGSSLGATQRAYHVDELKANENLKVDVKYYLAQQIHPVVSRLCDPIEGTNAARIAESLGLDPSKYHHVYRGPANDEIDVGESLVLSDEEKYRNCEKFKFVCKNESCKAEIIMDDPVRKVDDKFLCFALEKCSNPQCTVEPTRYLASIQNSLTMITRRFIHRYYENWLICEDPICLNRTQLIPLEMTGNYPECDMCKSALMYREYNEYELFTQLSFFQHIFDLSKVTDKRPNNLELEKAYDKLREQTERTLRHSGYSVVDLSAIFQRLLAGGKTEDRSSKTEDRSSKTEVRAEPGTSRS